MNANWSSFILGGIKVKKDLNEIKFNEFVKGIRSDLHTTISVNHNK